MQEDSIIAVAFTGIAFRTLPCSMNRLTTRASQSSSKPHFILEILVLRRKVCVGMNGEKGNSMELNCMRKENHLPGLLCGATCMAAFHGHGAPGSAYLPGTQEQLLGPFECTRD